MKVIVYGASGKVGRLVVDRLLAAGHSVSVFVHQTSIATGSVQVFKGDIHDLRAVGQAVAGHDAVISCLGSWHTPQKDILSAAMRGILPAMQEQGIRRIITLTGSGALTPHESVSAAGRVAHGLFGLIARDIIRDAETHLALLGASKLDWTTLRAPIMRGGAGNYELNQHLPGLFETVGRGAVAKAIVDQLTDTTRYRQAPHVHMR